MYWLAWAVLFPAGGRRLLEAVERFGSPRRAWEAPATAFDFWTPSPRGDPRELLKKRGTVDPVREAQRLAALDIKMVTWDDADYPARLREIYDPPAVFFYRGTLAQDDEACVAVVGSRRCTHYGRMVAEELGAGLARAGLTVVSGMARGIDSAAHRGALGAGGRTVAVLGTGLDICYPRENSKLMQEIAASGAVVSEFPLGSPPEPWHFPVRNRIISGLSRGVVVVEAAARSGALITAELALEQGRDVMAVPGNVTSPSSQGTNRLIKQGARLVEGVEDVLDELGLASLFAPDAGTEAAPSLTPLEQALLQRLKEEGGPVGEDALLGGCGAATPEAKAALTFLELKGLVRRLPGRLYCSLSR